uniref:Tyr recombinase domain-containing protein n=1 Tax=Amphimedon queenslandica TaxID=400682 RepID=A0A1X7VWD6_AMPQE
MLGRSGHATCPVAALRDFLLLRPRTEGPLFIMEDSISLSRQGFIQAVHQALQDAGLNPSLYAGHSFRMGAATTAAVAGIPAHTIKRLGRWSSDAYQIYIKPSDNSLGSISAMLAASSSF